MEIFMIPSLSKWVPFLSAVVLAACGFSVFESGQLGPSEAPPLSPELGGKPAPEGKPGPEPEPAKGGGEPEGKPPIVYPVIAAAGDIAEDEEYELQTADLLAAMKPAAVLTLGDNAYGSGSVRQFAELYEPSWGKVKAVTRPAPGNHDHATARLGGYCSYFGEAAGCKADGFAYYSFDVGDWHLISIDSGCSLPSLCGSPLGAGSPQRTWLTQDLQANAGKKCVLAYWHHPRWSSGDHGNDTRTADMLAELYAAGVDVVLTGHDHNYERFAPQNPAGDADPEKGLVQFVVGTGGAPHRALGELQPNSAASTAAAGDHGVLKMTLKPDRMDFEFVGVPGAAFKDTGTIVCH
jgi:hypothetical protein